MTTKLKAGAETPTYVERPTCRLCGHAGLATVLNLGDQYLIRFVKERNDLLPRAPLELGLCNACGLLQLKHSVDPKLLWTDYYYRSGINQSMKDALADVIKTATDRRTEGTWLDVGANDGTLLSMVPDTFEKIGVEPAKNLLALLEEHADVVIPDFFNGDHALLQGGCDVVTSCACFYDVNDPGNFVRGITQVLSRNGIWINQLNDAETMVARGTFDGICHEHAAYYSIPNLHRLYAENGLRILEITHNEVNGGSIRVVAAKGLPFLCPHDPIPRAEIFAFAERVRRWKQLMGWVLDSFKLAGRRVYGYGASTKLSVMLQHLGRADDLVAIADRNPSKFGTLMAGTWNQVTSEEDMRRARPDVLFVGPYSFRTEFLQREKDLRDKGTLFVFPLPNVEIVP